MTPTEVFLIALLFASVGFNGILWGRLKRVSAWLSKLEELVDLLASKGINHE
jgi:hypothetical protein